MKQIKTKEKDYIEKYGKGSNQNWECQLSIKEDMYGSNFYFEFISPKNEIYKVYNNKSAYYVRNKVYMSCEKQMSIKALQVFYDENDKGIIEEPYEITIKTILGMSDHATNIMRKIITNLNSKVKLAKIAKKEMSKKNKIIIYLAMNKQRCFLVSIIIIMLIIIGCIYYSK